MCEDEQCAENSIEEKLNAFVQKYKGAKSFVLMALDETGDGDHTTVAKYIIGDKRDITFMLQNLTALVNAKIMGDERDSEEILAFKIPLEGEEGKALEELIKKVKASQQKKAAADA